VLRFYDHTRWKSVLGYCLLIVVLGFWLVRFAQSPPIPSTIHASCQTEMSLLSSQDWQLTSSGLPFQVLWQKTEQRPTRTTFSFDGLVAFSNQVVFKWEYFEYNEDNFWIACSRNELVALDLETGNIEWRYEFSPTAGANFRSLSTLSDGVVSVSDGLIIKLDDQEHEVWYNDGFPSRSIVNAYFSDDIYLPSGSKFFRVSAHTGALLNEIEIPNPIGVIKDHIVTATSNEILHLQSMDGRRSIDFSLDDPNLVQNNYLFAFIDQFEDKFLTYDQYQPIKSIHVYSLNSGELLWRRDLDFETRPVTLNGRLAVYDHPYLEIIDINTGDSLGSIEFNYGGSKIAPMQGQAVQLAAFGDTIIIRFEDTWDIIAIRLNS
jgi:outer membrane protein assembly factor BamB